MDFLKVLLILLSLLFLAIPFLLEWLTFHKDKKRKIGIRRFRMVIFTLVYVIAVTVVLYLLKELRLWFESLGLVQWVANQLAVSGRVQYCTQVVGAILVNIALGFLYVLLSKPLRIGLKKEPDQPTEQQEEKKTSFSQRMEQALNTIFNKEIWFFVGRIFKWLFIVLSVCYGLLFVLYQIPVFFGANWIPYNFILDLFEAAYHYPVITLLALCQIAFFLLGVQLVENECPALEKKAEPLSRTEVDLAAIDRATQEKFSAYYACEVDLTQSLTRQAASADHSDITRHIAAAVQADRRNPQENKEIFLNCLDRLVESENSMVINGAFCSEFSMYFLRYLSLTLARGDNILVVCNSDKEIDAIHDYIEQGLSEISSLYQEGHRYKDKKGFDKPIWSIAQAHGDARDKVDAKINNASILVASLDFLCSAYFGTECKHFIHLLDTVVFVDALTTANASSRQLSDFHISIRQLLESNARKARDASENKGYRVSILDKQVRYFCFDPSGASGLDKVLKNLLNIPFDSADALYFGPNTLVRCYNLEGRKEEQGRRAWFRGLSSDEEIGPIMNMAIWCLNKGADNVTVLASKKLPYENYTETLAAHAGKLTVAVDGENIRVNKYHYNPKGYCVIIAMDEDDDLPVAIRKCASLAADKPTLVMVFSRQYLLREYYQENIAELWGRRAFARIPVENGGGMDGARRIAIMANYDGISPDEIMNIAADCPYFKTEFQEGNIDGILRKVLVLYGISEAAAENIYDHFEYKTIRDFDADGQFRSVSRVYLRQEGGLCAKVSGQDVARLKIGNVTVPLQVPAKRLTQRYIKGQNLLYNGSIYTIREIKTDEGLLEVRLASGGKNNEAHEYIQAREYRLEAADEKMECIYSNRPEIILEEKDEIRVGQVHIAAFRVPAEVLTHGYFRLEPHSLICEGPRQYMRISDEPGDNRARQTYRKYGDFSKPTFSSESIMGKAQLVSNSQGILVLDLKIACDLGGAEAKAAQLAAVMLEELLRLMFPSVAEAIAVCAVGPNAGQEDDLPTVLRRHSRLTLLGDSQVFRGEGFELAILEDSAADLGVISTLTSAGDDVLHTLFQPIFEYLKWYMAAAEKPSYLYCGQDREPDCFDFGALYKLSQIMGDDKRHVQNVDMNEETEYHSCSFCGKKYPISQKLAKVDEVRLICDECAQKLVVGKRELRGHMEAARRYLESTYGIVLDDSYEVCFESTEKIIAALKKNKGVLRRGADHPVRAYIDKNQQVHIENSVPEANLAEILVRELTHAWQLEHMPKVEEALAEGHIALVGIQYLRFLGHHALAGVRTRYYESNEEVSGKGYRKLAAELVNNPQYKHNPFRYLLSAGDGPQDKPLALPVRKPMAEGDLGRPYPLEKSDRARDGELTYFCYENLTATCQAAYSTLLAAIENHETSARVKNCSCEDVKQVSNALVFDHPELFWYKGHSTDGTEVRLFYGASAEDTKVLQKRIDEAVSRYLEGIDDSMSAYDVAVRLHAKVIAAVDYDTIALEKEEDEGGPAKDKIDYLRTICGVFLDGKAVCAGYACAMQYLLQKCGIESSKVSGYLKKENGTQGGAHAWNLVKIDGDYYYMDTTWDDNSDTIQSVKNTDYGFDYFCITTEELLQTRDTSRCPVPMPRCTATKANYFYHNDAVLDSYDPAKIKTLAQTAAQSKATGFAVKCLSDAVYAQALDQLCVKGADCFEALKLASRHNKQIQPEKYSYSCNKTIRTIRVNFKFK